MSGTWTRSTPTPPGFPIPMRGNEDTVWTGMRVIASFPIPMRGNEAYHGTVWAWDGDRFQSP